MAVLHGPLGRIWQQILLKFSPQTKTHIPMRTYKIYGSISATAEAGLAVIVVRNCRVKSIRWEASFDAPADNAAIALELSTVSTSHLAASDSTGDISTLRFLTNFVTSGMAIGRASKQEFVDFPVAANERLYIHTLVVGTVTCAFNCYIDVAEGS
jgi:hypothetical protein